MTADNRKTWTYKGLKIIPVDCENPTPDYKGIPFKFTTVLRNRYWRIRLSEKHWVRAESKSSAKEWIDTFEAECIKWFAEHPDGLKGA